MRRRLSTRLIIIIGLFILELIIILALLAFATNDAAEQSDQMTLQSVYGKAVSLADNASTEPLNAML